MREKEEGRTGVEKSNKRWEGGEGLNWAEERKMRRNDEDKRKGGMKEKIEEKRVKER